MKCCVTRYVPRRISFLRFPNCSFTLKIFMSREKNSLKFFLSLLVILCSTPANATAVREVVLDNGLKALLLEYHNGRSVTVAVWNRDGSRYVKDGKSGL